MTTTYAAAIKSQSPPIVRALEAIVGCPVGAWGETAQALRDLEEALPRAGRRAYSRDELVAAALSVDAGGRYRWREDYTILLLDGATCGHSHDLADAVRCAASGGPAALSAMGGVAFCVRRRDGLALSAEEREDLAAATATV